MDLSLLIQLGVIVLLAVVFGIVLRWLLGRGKLAEYVDEDARKLIVRSMTTLLLLGGVLVVLASTNPEIGRDLAVSVVAFLPKLAVGTLILILAVVLGRLLGVLVEQVMRERSATIAGRLRSVITAAIIGMGTLLALDQIGVSTDIINLVLGISLAALGLGAGLALGMGSLPLARNVAAGRHVDERFEPGHVVRLGEHAGRITSIGLASTRLETLGGDVWEVPHSEFLANPVQVVSSPEPDEDPTTTDDDAPEGDVISMRDR